MIYAIILFTAGAVCTTVAACQQTGPGIQAGLLIATIVVTMAAIGRSPKP